MTAQSAPYGSWASPVDVGLVAENDGRPGWLSHDGESLWWVRPMPAEGGRSALLRSRGDGAGPAEVVVPAPWNVRSRVHEYGGRAYVPVPGRSGAAVVFSEFSDQRLYLLEPGADAEPRPLSPQPARPAGWRYVEPVLAPDGDAVWCVREEHVGPAPTDVRRALVSVPLDGSAAGDESAVRVLVVDRHFLACPRPSPEGRSLAWIGWEHPDMPWDSTELRVARIDADGTVGPAVTVAGGRDESVVQVEWESAQTLLLLSDASGWWNLHRLQLAPDGTADGAPVNLCPRDEEFGGALWQLGMQWFAPLPSGDVAVIHGGASTRLDVLDPGTGQLRSGGDERYTEWAPTLATSEAGVIGVAAAPDVPYAVVGAAGRIGESEDGSTAVQRVLPVPSPRTFTGPGGREIHAAVYPPRHPDLRGPDGELPPYVVFVHGGPTSRVPMVHDLEIAYFTSRGIGVAEVNYGGSTGHGREYRNRLRENWGVVDVEDCVAVAQALAAEGSADPARLGIRGGSAGGWTSAAALTFDDTFACGVIMYPILDLAGWRTGETHDFESQYLESLVGPWPATAQRYADRSPINYPEGITAPFLLLQGLEDEICPPVQCERFVERIAGRGVPHAYLTFEGEQHGFRRKETIVTALQAELSLYAQVFGFTPADDVPTLALTT